MRRKSDAKNVIMWMLYMDELSQEEITCMAAATY